MKKQIGIYFIILGIFSLMLFAASVKANQTKADWFLAGIGLVIFGIITGWRGSKRSADERYFRTWRRLRSRSKKRE
jgi:uncharacterized membrane protein